jgi:two-component system phosphate regulon sensor histidine kinase PhoR
MIIGYLLVATVFAAAWLWSLYGPLTDAVLKQQQRNLTAVAQSSALVVTQSDQQPQHIVEQLVSRTDLRMTIVLADGEVLADSNFDPSLMENHSSRPEVRAALEGGVGVDRRTSRTESIEQLYVAVPATVDGERVAVRISQPLDEIRAIASRSRQVGLLLLLAASAMAVGIAVATAREIARPIQELSQSAWRMAEGNLSVQIPEVPADLEQLADALTMLKSQMRARIDALEAEQRTLRATLDGLTDAVLVLEQGRIRVANAVADELFRTPARGWEGVSLDSSGLPASLQAAIREHALRSDVTVVELDSDPTGRSLRVMVAPLEPDMPGGRTIVVVSDVTERARLELVRRDFVANASHELKTPVAGIRLLAESAETAAADGDEEQAVEFARQIAVEIERLQRLVGDLLDLSRLESVPSSGALVDIRAVVDNAVISHRAAAARKNLSIDVDLTAVRDTDVFATADPTDVAIALDNLMDNAIAYTEVGSVSVAVRADESFVTITVADTGAGIPPEELPRIFERFYRVDRGRSRESGGTGLGLALVRHVVERSGGSVHVDSDLGKGSVFTLRLRRAV